MGDEPTLEDVFGDEVRAVAARGMRPRVDRTTYRCINVRLRPWA